METALGKVFADDTKLIGRIVDILTKFLLQDDLHNVVAWAERNNMQLNESKFEILNYSLNNSMLLRNLPFVDEYHHYSLTSGATIEPSHTVRDLGVLLSDDCSWTVDTTHSADAANIKENGSMGSQCIQQQITISDANTLQNYGEK